jgi:hypothetical protein
MLKAIVKVKEADMSRNSIEDFAFLFFCLTSETNQITWAVEFSHPIRVCSPKAKCKHTLRYMITPGI